MWYGKGKVFADDFSSFDRDVPLMPSHSANLVLVNIKFFGAMTALFLRMFDA